MNLWIPEDSLEEKFALAYKAAAEGLDTPIYILSHRRATRLRTWKAIPWIADQPNVHIVVAANQEKDYRAAGWRKNLMVIPEDYAGLEEGVGRAHQFVLETADLLGQDRILVLDDDMLRISILYAIGGGKVSHAYASLVEGRRDEFTLGCVALTVQCAEEAFRAHPDAVLASPQVNSPNRTTKSSEKRWHLNTGGNSAQFQYWAVDRWHEKVGAVNLEQFNRHGDDISNVCDIIEAGGQLVLIPSIITGWGDYETESVLRTPENAPALRLDEHNALVGKPFMGKYIRTRTDMLDRPQWHSIDWAALKKDGHVKEDFAYWDDLPRDDDDEEDLL